jgi:hypothetical protein
MIRTALAVLVLAMGSPALGQTPQAGAPAAETSAAKPEEPKKICTKEYITGSRVKKQLVCRTVGFDKDAERAQDGIRKFMNGSGNIVPHPPGVPG